MTIRERIAKQERIINDLSSLLDRVVIYDSTTFDSLRTVRAREERKLDYLRAVEAGTMVEVYSTVSVTKTSGDQIMWMAYGHYRDPSDSRVVLSKIDHGIEDKLTILRGFAYVPQKSAIPELETSDDE